MTAPVDRDREELAAALVRAESDGTLVWGTEEVVRLLAPVVARREARAKAEAQQPMVALLDVLDRITVGYVPQALRDAMDVARAAALDTEGNDR